MKQVERKILPKTEEMVLVIFKSSEEDTQTDQTNLVAPQASQTNFADGETGKQIFMLAVDDNGPKKVHSPTVQENRPKHIRPLARRENRGRNCACPCPKPKHVRAGRLLSRATDRPQAVKAMTSYKAPLKVQL